MQLPGSAQVRTPRTNKTLYHQKSSPCDLEFAARGEVVPNLKWGYGDRLPRLPSNSGSPGHWFSCRIALLVPAIGAMNVITATAEAGISRCQVHPSGHNCEAKWVAA